VLVLWITNLVHVAEGKHGVIYGGWFEKQVMSDKFPLGNEELANFIHADLSPA